MSSFPDPATIAGVVGNCLLCDGPRHVLGCFVPEEPGEWTNVKIKAGKTRTIWYALCEPCLNRPDSTDAVEAEIRRRKTEESN